MPSGLSWHAASRASQEQGRHVFNRQQISLADSTVTWEIARKSRFERWLLLTMASSSHRAQSYYNSADADNFYFRVWGGIDIHVGIYEREDEEILPASRRTVEMMAQQLPFELSAKHRVLDIGAGYGGASRFLASRFGCSVVSFNLSERQNDRNRMFIEQDGLQHLVTVVQGNFEELPFENESFDVVWSQDSLLHSDRRDRVVAEVARVLKKGGCFLFSDLMQMDMSTPSEQTGPLLARLQLSNFGSPDFYEQEGLKHGLRLSNFSSYPQHMATHYRRVKEELLGRSGELVSSGDISQAFIDGMCRGLDLWVKGAQDGIVTWGFLLFQKQGY